MTRSWLILVLCALVGSVRASGHHSFASYYSEDQTVSIEGILVELDYRNPHAFVHLLAQDNRGQMQRVSAEWASPARLSREGVARDTLKPGDRLIVTGSPSRDPAEYQMHLKGMQRVSDGWKWVAGDQFR